MLGILKYNRNKGCVFANIAMNTHYPLLFDIEVDSNIN